MSRTLIVILQILLVTGIFFGIGVYLAKRMEKKKRARRKLEAHSLPMSAFSMLDHPAMHQANDDMSAIDEAEVFMIYGKKAKALEVLSEALAKNRITRDAYDAFKAKHNIE